MEIDKLLIKTPFRRPLPMYDTGFMPSNGNDTSVPTSRVQYVNVSQDLFLTELDPNGHKINDPYYYADRQKVDEKGKTYIHFVERCAFPIQDVITTKQLTHLAGNPISFVNCSVNPTEEEKIRFLN